MKDRCTCRYGRDVDGSEFGPCEFCENAGYDQPASAHDPICKADLVAFGASDAACYEYPEEDQAELRAAFCKGAAHVLTDPICKHDWEKTHEDTVMFVCSKCRLAYTGCVGIPALVEANKRRILADFHPAPSRRTVRAARIMTAILTIAIAILDRKA